MKSHWKFAVRVVAVMAASLLSLSFVWKVLLYKDFHNGSKDRTNTTSTFCNFYDLEEDSLDVLFLGTSHAMDGFIPQVLYNEYGITSYNLGTSSQSMVVSYFWLKEALQTQKPKVVILDTHYLVYYTDGPLNASEQSTRQALSYMKWGEVKAEAIRTVCEEDDTFSYASWLLPNIRFHERWKELEMEDFLLEEKTQTLNFLGYAYFSGTNSYEYTPLTEGASDERAEMIPLMEEYVDKIAALCEEEGIELILIKTPTTAFTIESHNAVTEYAQENGLAFYDLNLQTIYDEMEFDFHKDMIDGGHANLSGAEKITRYVGEILHQEYGLQSHTADYWEETNDTWQNLLTDVALSGIDDLEEYLTVLTEEGGHYTVFLTVMDDASSCLSEKERELMTGLGLEADWSDACRSSYCAVIEGGKVQYESMSDEAILRTGAIMNGRYQYSMTSAGLDSGNVCSVIIGDAERAVQSRGLNIVVFCNERQIVVDSVCFDTHTVECTVTR